MHIALASDDRYAKPMTAAICSVLENNREADRITFHILDSEISKKNKEKIMKTVGAHDKGSVVFYDFLKLMSRFDCVLTLTEPSLPRVSYARLFLGEILPLDVEKIIYLDSDMICVDSLQEIWEMDMGDHLVAGALDTARTEARVKVGLSPQSVYINSGFLVINISLWRKENTLGAFLAFIKERGGNVFHNDQGVINGVIPDRIRIIAPRYNAMTPYFMVNHDNLMGKFELDAFYTAEEIEEAVSQPAILHFVAFTASRPWERHCRHPLRHEYRHYLEKSAWGELELEKNHRSVARRALLRLYEKLPGTWSCVLARIYRKARRNTAIFCRMIPGTRNHR